MLTLSDFDFPLPPELIAQSALPDRSASRLLVVERTAPRTRRGGAAGRPRLQRHP
jgi:S-adenosylmethionine:tRNA ribosyltransferase-isomerase